MPLNAAVVWSRCGFGRSWSGVMPEWHAAPVTGTPPLTARRRASADAASNLTSATSMRSSATRQLGNGCGAFTAATTLLSGCSGNGREAAPNRRLLQKQRGRRSMSSATPRPQHLAQCAATGLQTGPGTGRYKTSRTRFGARDSNLPRASTLLVHIPSVGAQAPGRPNQCRPASTTLEKHVLGSVSGQ
jgi:hypothetical protein